MDNIKIPIWLRVIEVLIIVIIIIAIAYFKYYKEYLASLGSSDIRITEKYKTMTEFYISNGPNFILVIDQNNKVSNILFLNKESICLYNKNIEKSNINQAISKIIQIINNDNYFNSINNITLFDYGDELVYNDIKEQTNKNIELYEISTAIIDNKTTIEEKADSLNIAAKTKKDLLAGISYYSKNLVSRTVNNVSWGEKYVKNDKY